MITPWNFKYSIVWEYLVDPIDVGICQSLEFLEPSILQVSDQQQTDQLLLQEGVLRWHHLPLRAHEPVT